MGWLVVVEHEVDNVELRAYEDDLEDGVPDIFRRVRPEEVEVSRYVDGEVEELRLEGYAGCALHYSVSPSELRVLSDPTHTRRSHLGEQDEDRGEVGQVGFALELAISSLLARFV
jgi:hypothetical protein